MVDLSKDWRLFFDTLLLEEIADVFDRHLARLGEEAAREHPDISNVFERQDYFVGIGFVACQAFVNEIVGTKRLSYVAIEEARKTGSAVETEESKRRRAERRNECLDLGPRVRGHSIAAVVNAAANYFKHEPEPDLNPRTIVVLDAFAPRDQNGRRSMHDLLFELLNPEPPGFRTILPLLTQWRDAVMEASKRGGWGSTL
jgi:hypothetical protein